MIRKTCLLLFLGIGYAPAFAGIKEQLEVSKKKYEDMRQQYLYFEKIHKKIAAAKNELGLEKIEDWDKFTKTDQITKKIMRYENDAFIEYYTETHQTTITKDPQHLIVCQNGGYWIGNAAERIYNQLKYRYEQQNNSTQNSTETISNLTSTEKIEMVD